MSTFDSESEPDRRVVLVVGDEADGRHSTALVLAAAGYVVMEATCREAIYPTRARRLVAVVVEGELQGLAGSELCSKIKEQSPDDPPILHLSGAAAVDRLRGLCLGVDRYIIKPATPAELLGALGSLLPENERRGRRGEDGDRRKRQRGGVDRRALDTGRVVTNRATDPAGDLGVPTPSGDVPETPRRT
jgi:DNA-binding response OmpR family regulator